MHEVINVQIGETANYVGTHFWNIQESYFTYGTQEESPVDHNVNFRPGIGADGSDTFTPRALIYDFKGRFGTLRKFNELYQIEEDHQASNNAPILSNTALGPQPRIPLHGYQQALNNNETPPQLTAQNVRFWSDFNRVFYSPKSIIQIYEDELSPQQAAFDQFAHGDELFDTISRKKDLLDDDLRPLVEECDQMQGMQLLTSVDDGWGGFSSRYVDTISDEYGKTSLWLWALSSKAPTSRVLWIENIAHFPANSC